MSSHIRTIVIVFALAASISAQSLTREQKLQAFRDLRAKMSSLENDILQPDAQDAALAAKDGLGVIRLLPRESYDRLLKISGGGAYYSFARKVQEYGYGSDIEMEKNQLRVGFAGADYGFLIDAGEIGLAGATKESPETSFLLSYSPPSDEPALRAEARKVSTGYEGNGFLYKNAVPAIVGHTYILRSLNILRSDILVAFNVLRKDPDGSLILLWKPLATFSTPEMTRSREVAAGN